MGVTGAIYKGLIFDGINSKDYGVYITGAGVYNAPERDTESIAIPGRNGSFIRDNGRFNNITVTYPAGLFGNNQTEFAEKIKNLRNLLASRVGYCRLTDEYNRDEYRMAVYKSGLDVSPSSMGRAGQFDITFECKPQRFLNSGEIDQEITSGGKLYNPTLFNAHPLVSFQASGGGSITIGDKMVQFYNAPLGTIDLPYTVQTQTNQESISFNGSYNTGDTFTFKGAKFTVVLTTPSGSILYITPGQDLFLNPLEIVKNGNTYYLPIEDAREASFAIGTARTLSKTITLDFSFGGATYTQTIEMTITYSGGTAIGVRVDITTTGGATQGAITFKSNYVLKCDSTANSLTGDLYMDLDIGEAYRVESGHVVSINNFTDLGGELPTLPPGETAIMYSANISNVKITPRWWQI